MLRANNEVIRLLFAAYTFATEVVLFEKLGKNEVFATSFFSSIFGRKISRLLNTLPVGMHLSVERQKSSPFASLMQGIFLPREAFLRNADYDDA
ncbi:MAG: hypothetical protein LBO71_06530 [Prevotellaceae bacterium]|jgi:hypothetical protein|nr:hypothetical protein [Prevotellaceae bacterium]